MVKSKLYKELLKKEFFVYYTLTMGFNILAPMIAVMQGLLNPTIIATIMVINLIAMETLTPLKRLSLYKTVLLLRIYDIIFLIVTIVSYNIVEQKEFIIIMLFANIPYNVLIAAMKMQHVIIIQKRYKKYFLKNYLTKKEVFINRVKLFAFIITIFIGYISVNENMSYMILFAIYHVISILYNSYLLNNYYKYL